MRQLKDQAGKLGSTYGETDSAPLEPVQTYSQLALSFLSAAEILDPVAPRTVYRRKMPKVTVSPDAFQKLSDEEQKAFTAFQCDESTYYGHYSTPLAWARPFDRLGRHGLKSFDGKQVLDFGFGNVGQLQMMASLGANVTGVEIDGSIPSALYRLDADQGDIDKYSKAVEHRGTLNLVFGKWPAEQGVRESVGSGFDLFISKNVLKYGYIHPEQDAPSSQLIDLGVDDRKFLSHLFQILNPGGLVLIYNLHPPKSAAGEPYKPWAYGETPWKRKLVEESGFEVVEWHIDDSDAIHTFGQQVGWGSIICFY